ncbi:MAG: sugar ABC transporter ATP-binding protein [Candidatus Humimicrobiaceae bacterium]
MEEYIKESSTDDNYILQMLNIIKDFSGVRALKGVDFKLKKGEVHGLVGENGAGKSTLMKILMGVYTKDSGTIIINGKEVDLRSAGDAYKHGVGMVFQELSLIPQLTVSQNIFLKIEPRRKLPMFVNDNATVKSSLQLMEKYKININPKLVVENLNRGYSQIVEILKVLAQNANILIMDEPTASLTKSEEETLYEIISNLKDQGVSIIYISHRLREIFNVCDRVTILRNGLNVETKDIDKIQMKELVELITGKIMTAVHHHNIDTSKKSVTKNLLEVKGLAIKPRVNDVSFTVAPGEIVAITGIMGSGKSEIARVLFGIDRADRGDIYMEGKKLNIKNPSDAINAGIALVPEDRRNEGLVLNQTVEANLTLPIVGNISRGGFISDIKSSKKALDQINKLSIKTPSIRQETAYLSGGNQQKIVIGKWLMENRKLLILDEPTVGVDVETKAELRNIISDLVSSRKCSVILFSSELNEIIQLADRIIVLYQGTVFKEFSNVPPIQEAVLHSTVQGLA